MLGKVEICGINTALLPKISDKKAKEMLQEIKKGNQTVREEFITCNFRLVLSIM